MATRDVAWSLARKVSFALVAVLLFTVSVTAFFAYYKFESVYSGLVQSRYSFVVFTIKKKVEDSLNLGFALRQLRQIQDLLEREKVRDAQILAIEVYNADGEVLFDTDRGAIGMAVPRGWLEAVRGSPTQPFGEVEEDTLVVGLPLVNGLGKVEGGVVLRYPAAYLKHAVAGLVGDVARDATLAALASAVVAVAGLYWLFGSVTRKLAGMEHTLQAVLAEGGQAVPDPGSDEFEERFAEFVAKTREAVDHIRDATQEVERLDRLA
ncbi:MAG: hypothetical protein ACM31L_09270 [Actinomycetota bacterium]